MSNDIFEHAGQPPSQRFTSLEMPGEAESSEPSQMREKKGRIPLPFAREARYRGERSSPFLS